jgi:hypothetical protein
MFNEKDIVVVKSTGSVGVILQEIRNNYVVELFESRLEGVNRVYRKSFSEDQLMPF